MNFRPGDIVCNNSVKSKTGTIAGQPKKIKDGEKYERHVKFYDHSNAKIYTVNCKNISYL